MCLFTWFQADRVHIKMATPNNNNASDEDKIDPMKDVRAGIVREVGGQAIWSLSSCKPGKIKIVLEVNIVIQSIKELAFQFSCVMNLENKKLMAYTNVCYHL